MATISYTHGWNLTVNIIRLALPAIIAAYLLEVSNPFIKPYFITIIGEKSDILFVLEAIIFIILFFIALIPIGFLTYGIDSFLYFRFTLGIPISLKEARNYDSLLELDDKGNWDSLSRIKNLPENERKCHLESIARSKKYNIPENAVPLKNQTDIDSKKRQHWFRKFRKKKNSEKSNESFVKNPQKKLQISSESILWIEKELLKLNREIVNEDRPKHNLNFLQSIPKVILTKDVLSTDDVAEAVTDLVKQTRERIGNLDVPFRKPKVEFTKNLPNQEPGHIEFGWDETIIRIHPQYADNPFALTAILCHELAHFILDHNGLRKSDQKENEKLTDFFVFRCGQGLIYLQGVYDIVSQNGETIESTLGYLSLNEMAYAHARCASQHGLPTSKILPEYFTGKTFRQVDGAINFLQIKKDNSRNLAEIILCPNQHILRISPDKKSYLIRCPKCGWKKEIWFHKKDHIDYLINQGTQDFDEGKLNQALEKFREVQSIDRKYSMAYCWASRCLKKQGFHQEAIKELRKILTISPDDEIAQSEMKTLLYKK